MRSTRLTPEELRRLKALFGRPTRVVLAAWVHEMDQAFFVSEAQDALSVLGLGRSGVADELKVLEAQGLLTSFADGGRLYCQRIDSTFWPTFAALSKALIVDEPADSLSRSGA